MATKATKRTAVGPVGTGVGNGAEAALDLSQPYIVEVTIEGTADILFRRWDCDEVEAKSKAAKNSAAKKTDNLETAVYRNDAGVLCLPGENLRMSIINAAKFRQDPRSPRKSAMDLYKAGVITLTALAPLGVSDWDYAHKGRVTVQRQGVTRIRPALRAGWRATVQFLVNTPEYISPQDLHATLNQAGRLIGVGDFRPTYGRFLVTAFEVVSQEW